MPTYLTPGVYVEEVPSASKPIEGVSTSIAAFVGLAPGGPVNTPMRISNWTQFAKIFGDPNEPDNGPFMEGAYLAHSVYGFFQNGGNLCWIVRVGDEGGDVRRRARRAAGRGRRDGRDVPRHRARERQRRRERRGDRGAERRRRRRQDLHRQGLRRLRERGVHGPEHEEGPLQPRDQGQRGLQAGQGRGHRRLAARGPARPGDRQLQAVRRRRSTPARSSRPTSRATSPSARAWAASPRSTRSRWS